MCICIIYYRWLEACLKTTLPPVVELEDRLRNGVLLAKLGNFIAPATVPVSCIYDRDERRYKTAGLQYRHTDNINYWLKSLNVVNLPKVINPKLLLKTLLFENYFIFRYFILKLLMFMIRRICQK